MIGIEPFSMSECKILVKMQGHSLRNRCTIYQFYFYFLFTKKKIHSTGWAFNQFIHNQYTPKKEGYFFVFTARFFN